MEILLKNTVEKDFISVADGFDLKLFKALKPPLIYLKVDRFDGCQKGDQVRLKVGLPVFSSTWDGEITFSNRTDQQFQFIDVGLKLPFPLKTWKHIHTINKIDENKTEIIDNIFYDCGNAFMNTLMYPALYLQFYYRKFAYKSYFN